ncbi:hypothetical protein SALBM135S_02939 [Streptomyces alboniger]
MPLENAIQSCARCGDAVPSGGVVVLVDQSPPGRTVAGPVGSGAPSRWPGRVIRACPGAVAAGIGGGGAGCSAGCTGSLLPRRGPRCRSGSGRVPRGGGYPRLSRRSRWPSVPGGGLSRISTSSALKTASKVRVYFVIPIPKQEGQRVHAASQRHGEVPGLLGGPLGRWDGRRRRRGAGSQRRGCRGPGPSGTGARSGRSAAGPGRCRASWRICHTVDGAKRVAQARKLALDPAVAPAAVLSGQPQEQLPDGGRRARSAQTAMTGERPFPAPRSRGPVPALPRPWPCGCAAPQQAPWIRFRSSAPTTDIDIRRSSQSSRDRFARISERAGHSRESYFRAGQVGESRQGVRWGTAPRTSFRTRRERSPNPLPRTPDRTAVTLPGSGRIA